MNNSDRRPGTTLLELLVALTLLGVLLGLGVPALGHRLDRLAVRGARNALAAGVARARSAAIARGGARLVISPPRATFWVAAGTGAEVDTVAGPFDLAERYGVALEAGGRRRVALRFDALGIGRIASATIGVVRDGAEAGITVSSYGRVRRW